MQNYSGSSRMRLIVAKEKIFGVPENESENSPFTFSLFATREVVSTIITAIVTSKTNPSESYREETQLGFESPAEEAKKRVLGLVGLLSEKMMKKYTIDNPKHEDVAHFLDLTKKTVEEKLRL